ncbi:alpha/beta-hydrolase [Viridothelium virens]|uniref:Alpha/beta-hydrolase n=1 Tax=Viridothelium virens TaxID=1048519 RepID=A0A6A6H3L3_VIRVR|nr:alpha/beta-hydrolase [Viridothelium virens]
MNRGAALCDRISSRLNEVITSMDGQVFRGDEREMYILHSAPPGAQVVTRSLSEPAVPNLKYSSNYFAKVWQYANSRLPPHLPPLKVYMPTYPLLCLAAQYSEKVYARPTRAEQETHIAADWRRGTKAMVLKSVAVDDLNTIVFAIRGSQTFMDWAVNFRPAPASPKGFLDDPGNLCHSGFLSVARHMIAPVSTRLRTLIEENPSRRTYSLLICGHSAGGAVAALLFCHMLSSIPPKELVEPELVELAPFFHRIHCVTFGAPPVSLLPLQKPRGDRWKKSLFFSFINEGDPVVRADKQVVASLLKLYATPAPNEVMYEAPSAVSLQTLAQKRKPLANVKALGGIGKGKAVAQRMPTWNVPPSTLSNAGRLVLLRTEVKANGEEKVQACVTNDEQLRGAVFGDPICHSMTLYAKRIETLATQAVTMTME